LGAIPNSRPTRYRLTPPSSTSLTTRWRNSTGYDPCTLPGVCTTRARRPNVDLSALFFLRLISVSPSVLTCR
jgi:hypothetical protein